MEIFKPDIHDDSAPLTAEFMAKMKRSTRGRPNIEVTIHLDAKLVEHLRASGPGWQARVNAVLSEAVTAGRI